MVDVDQDFWVPAAAGTNGEREFGPLPCFAMTATL